jgi:hypothetical protein
LASLLVGIFNASIRLTSLKGSNHIMAELAKPFHYGEGKVLVGVKPAHDAYASSSRRIASSISSGWAVPCHGEVVQRQPLDHFHELLIGKAELPIMHEAMDRDAAPANASVTASDVRGVLHPTVFGSVRCHGHCLPFFSMTALYHRD